MRDEAFKVGIVCVGFEAETVFERARECNNEIQSGSVKTEMLDALG